MIRIITDSASDITIEEAKELGVEVVPLHVIFGNDVFMDGVDIRQDELYKRLKECDELPKTSQTNPGGFVEVFEKYIKQGDEIVGIFISSKLSGTYQSSIIASDMIEDGKIHIIDSLNASMGLAVLVREAVKMRDKGKSVDEIKVEIENLIPRVKLIAVVDTLKYLKKGGRITPAAAALGTILRLKPVLQIQGEKLDAYSKARTYKIAKNTMLDAIAKDIEERFDGKSSPEDIYIAIAHTDNLAAAEEFRDEVKAIYPEHDIYIDHLSLSVACHIGPGALAIAASKKLEIGSLL